MIDCPEDKKIRPTNISSTKFLHSLEFLLTTVLFNGVGVTVVYRLMVVSVEAKLLLLLLLLPS